jgi:hypothetical protein
MSCLHRVATGKFVANLDFAQSPSSQLAPMIAIGAPPHKAPAWTVSVAPLLQVTVTAPAAIQTAFAPSTSPGQKSILGCRALKLQVLNARFFCWNQFCSVVPKRKRNRSPTCPSSRQDPSRMPEDPSTTRCFQEATETPFPPLDWDCRGPNRPTSHCAPRCKSQL